MSKDKISDYSATANSNTDIAGINIDEGCAPSGINNAIRTLMKQLKDFQQGTNSDPFNGPHNGTVGATTPSTGAFTTLSASGVTTLSAGSASAPALTTSGDTNTGVLFPAADTVAIATGGTERARVDSSGNLGLGVTPSAWGSSYRSMQVGNNDPAFIAGRTDGPPVLLLGVNAYNDNTNWKYANSDVATLYTQYNGHQWYVAPTGTAGNAITFTQAMTLDASGRLLVGGTSASGSSYVQAIQTSDNPALGSVYGLAVVRSSNDSRLAMGYTSANDAWNISATYNSTGAYKPLAFCTSDTERMRIDSSGNLLVGTTTNINNSRLCVQKDLADNIVVINNTNSSAPYGVQVRYSNLDPNGTGSPFYEGYGYSGGFNLRFAVRSNGGIANYSANNVNLSDRREKTNFAPAKSYLDVICAIPVQTYNYIDQNMEDDDGLTLGVIAQDVQEVAPELVTESNWGTEENPKMRLSIYQTDMQYALMKCIQELKAENDSLKARLDAANL